MSERAALLHSYLADRKDPGKPDRLSRMGILAVAELYRNGEIDKICITVEPELAIPQERRLRSLLSERLREGDLVIKPQTVTTREEVQTFRELAEENGWNNLLTVGNKAHLPRIKK